MGKVIGNRTILNDDSDEILAEEASGVLTIPLLDEKDVAIPIAALTALTLTYYDEITNTIINTRDGQDVLNNGAVPEVNVSATGVIVWVLKDVDLVISGSLSPGEQESHIALFIWTYNGLVTGMKGRHEAEIFVENLNRVP